MPSINVIGPQNGFGNGRDMQIMVDVLTAAGLDVRPVGIVGTGLKARGKAMAKHLAAGRIRSDFNLFLGPMFHEWTHLARRNFIMPNPEFFPDRWLGRLRSYDLVLAKTRLTEALFAKLGPRTAFTSFTSADRYIEAPRAEAPRFLHVSSTRWKGTDALAAEWARHPEWPELLMIANRSKPQTHGAANIRLIDHYLSEQDLMAVQNESTVHICCSEAEGFGHYINEAMSTRAVVLTTDGPPMNELVDHDRGMLVKARESAPMNLSRKYFFDEEDLAAKVETVLQMSVAERERMGDAARTWFKANDHDFHDRVSTLAADWIASTRR